MLRDARLGIGAGQVRHMTRSRISPDDASRCQEVFTSGESSALRGFIDDIAVLFDIMLGRDMVQRSPTDLPDGPGSADAAVGPH